MFSRSTIRVLYVDGRSAAAETVPNRLHREDDRFVVHAVATPSAALEYLADNDVDCVVPEYDGLDLLESVRADAPEHPFILFTRTGSEEIASRAIIAGVTDNLREEGNEEQYVLLANRIQHAVERRRGRRNGSPTR